MSPATATLLNGTVLWGLVYFLPILSGTIADKYGYKKSLSVSLVLISIGYLMMGNLQGFWPGLTGAAEGAPVNLSPSGRDRDRLHRDRRFDRQALHRRDGPEDRRDARDPGLRHLLHGHQHRVDHRPGRLLLRSDNLRHPGDLHICGDGFRHPRFGRRPLSLQGAPVCQRREEGRPGRQAPHPGGGALGHYHRPAERPLRLLSSSSWLFSGSSTPSSTISCPCSCASSTPTRRWSSTRWPIP